ncbi:hypothetical protein IH992_33635, partial [Candidatus Poribacteria bacterium]|nr:hypothetical protein [Candidatus Poribacteria bacterium]
DSLREKYKFEFEHKQQLTTSLTFPVGVLVVLGGLLGTIAKQFSYESVYLTYVLFFLLGFAVIAFLMAIYFIVRSYHGYAYSYVPTPSEMREHYDALVRYYQEVEGDDQIPEVITKRTEEDFDDFLRRKYVHAIEVNIWENELKMRYLYYARSSLIAVLVLTLLCSIPYFFDTNTKPKKIYRVHIENLNESLTVKINKGAYNARKTESTQAESTTESTQADITTTGADGAPSGATTTEAGGAR